MYKWKSLSRHESNLLKGVGMLLILFHNYSHLVSPWAGENEFVFSEIYATFFVRLFISNPADFLRLVFAFFGHYGVELFIFVSGYGLYASYHAKNVKWWLFFKKHLLKLYPAYVLAVIFFLIFYSIYNQSFPSLWMFKFAVFDLLFIQNFVPDGALHLVGPWWFFSLIVQFYAIFPVILWVIRKYGMNAILVIGILPLILSPVLSPFFQNYNYRLNHFFIGWLPVFCLGIWFSSLREFKLPAWLIVTSFLIVVFGNLNKWVWPFAMPAVTISLLVLARWLFSFTNRSGYLTTFISWIGVNSLFIFSVHGFLRDPFVSRATNYNNPLITLALGGLFFITSILAALVVKWLESKIQKKLVTPFLESK